MSGDSFDKKVKRISHKNWDEIKDAWLGHLPLIQNPGSPPAFAIADFPDLQETVLSLGDTGELRFWLSGLREAVFHEAVFLIHKSVHVACASLNHSNAGILTWSLSSAYQGALFALKGTLGLLGISFPELNNVNTLVDVWPDLGKGKRRSHRGGVTKNEIQMIKMPNLQHWHLWQIFQRIARVTSINTWDPWLPDFLQRIHCRDFARQRNRIIYWNHVWIYDDLFQPLASPEFGHPLDQEFRDLDDFQNLSDFSIKLCFILLRNVLNMLKELVDEAPIVQGEWGLILSNLNNRGQIFIQDWFKG